MAQAFSRRSFTAEARVEFQASPCAICGGQRGIATGDFSEYFRVPKVGVA